MILFLTKEQKEELLSELSWEKNRKFADSIRVILLLDKRKPAIKIAECFDCIEGFYNTRRIHSALDNQKIGGIF